MFVTSFATVEQYEARYGSVSDTSMLQECLDDASASIRARLDKSGIGYTDPTPEYADRLMRVCRSMASRIMPSEDGASEIPFGATQMSQTAGPYNQQFTFGTGYGTAKMLPSEEELLGLRGGSKAGWADLVGGGACTE